jgi:hypothetical protein
MSVSKRVIRALLLLTLVLALVVGLSGGAGADRNANCKPNRAGCTVDSQCCSGVCAAGACSASQQTTTTTTPTSSTAATVTTTSTTTSTTQQRFVDNGNGTVTDNLTGLQWEKKDNTCPGIHCVNDTYTWCVGSDDVTCINGGVPDGTAFTSFLQTLNGGATGVGNCTLSDADGSHAGGFAGHCDWRLPTQDELGTIIDGSQGSCGGGSGACIDPTFGPTVETNPYWSSTTLARDSSVAWTFFFVFPFSNEEFKPGTAFPGGVFVRAVRGGMPD